jgi:hypothetical protein
MRVVGYTLGGFVAGEGSFIVTTGARLVDGSPRMRWVFDVSVARRDQHLLVALQALLGVGSVYERPARRPERQPISSFTVSSRKAHRERVIPFGEQFLLPCAKRRQFKLWRDSLYHYESVTPARTRSQCSIDGCDRLVRGRGLCRQHYYRATETDAAAPFAAGFIAAEGTFLRTAKPSFSCVVALGATDRCGVELLHDYFGVGHVRWFPRRKPHYDDEVRWTVKALRDLTGVIVPFMDVHLPVSYKRAQYLEWWSALLDCWEHGARRRGTCSEPGCDAPHRAYGWCRRHLYVYRRM